MANQSDIPLKKLSYKARILLLTIGFMTSFLHADRDVGQHQHLHEGAACARAGMRD